MLENLTEIKTDQLLNKVQTMFYKGYRFITATCVDRGDGSVDVTYHFDKDYKIKNYRLIIQKGDEVPSISKIYFCSVLVENEMKELFGLNVTDIAIDYGGHMLLSDDAPDSPMLRQQIVIEKREGKKDE